MTLSALNIKTCLSTMTVKIQYSVLKWVTCSFYADYFTILYLQNGSIKSFCKLLHA